MWENNTSQDDCGFNSIEGGEFFFNEKKINDMEVSHQKYWHGFSKLRHIPTLFCTTEC